MKAAPHLRLNESAHAVDPPSTAPMPFPRPCLRLPHAAPQNTLLLSPPRRLHSLLAVVATYARRTLSRLDYVNTLDVDNVVGFNTEWTGGRLRRLRPTVGREVLVWISPRSGYTKSLRRPPIGMTSIPEDLSPQDNNVLKHLYWSVVRSVNQGVDGTRLTGELLRLVPNVQVFRDTLRCVKLWAQRESTRSSLS
ncbi:hypothetical protein DFH07DRAFT_948150 [Mycena maculata]|uniref:Uncharacterized protein n=1 Tax=Mycena maculata TaxID=230809 RepID=A0AAD7KK85_9AGAR|nr:hypothetical protein DFH07DRAFT_948150 [Mycena maculata]